MNKTWKPPSKGAERVFKALKLLGHFTIIPEKHIGHLLKLDFYLPELRWGIEVQGVQHDTYNSFFYNNEDEFRDAQKRDKRKREMCVGEGVVYIALDYKHIMRSKSPQELLDLIARKAQEETKNQDATQEEDEW
jgi:hypothetical protein